MKPRCSAATLHPSSFAKSAISFISCVRSARVSAYSDVVALKVSREKILDLFGGSGSTLMAAERMGRRAFLMEIDPAYCDVIVRRWQEYTGREADGWKGND